MSKARHVAIWDRGLEGAPGARRKGPVEDEMAVVRWPRAGLGEGFARLEERLRGNGGAHAALAAGAVRRALGRRAFQVPAGLLLAASHFAGGVTEASVDLAVAVTALQAALRQHEAVREEVDEERRWLHTRWTGNNAAVLLGDYLLVLAYELLPPGRWGEELAEVVRAFSTVAMHESLTLEARLDDLARVQIARGKRGRLLAFCGRAGAVAGGGAEEVAAALSAFGEHVGTAQYLAQREWCPEQAAALGRSAQQVAAGLADGEAKRWLMEVVGRSASARRRREQTGRSAMRPLSESEP